jgi:hypothetical protein
MVHQVFTAVLMHYTRDQLPFTMFADSKVPNDIWGKNNGERYTAHQHRLAGWQANRGKGGRSGMKQGVNACHPSG